MQQRIPFDELLRIANRTTPFSSSDGRAFVHIPIGPARRTLPVRSAEFRDWFLMMASSEHERVVPTNQQFNAICRHLEAEATRYEHSVGVRVFRRVANRENKIQIDLANSDREFIDIDAQGYRVDIGEEGARRVATAFTRCSGWSMVQGFRIFQTLRRRKVSEDVSVKGPGCTR